MLTRISSFLCVLLLGAAPVAAQDFPSRAVTMIVPFTAGGPTDTLARHLAQSMGSTLKQQVIVENAPGAGGTIGSTKAAKAKPDGYTILIAHIGMSTAPALYRKLSFNPLTDYEYIGQVADGPMTLIAKDGFQPDNLKDLIAYVKANKAKINYGERRARVGIPSVRPALHVDDRDRSDDGPILGHGARHDRAAWEGKSISCATRRPTRPRRSRPARSRSTA